MPTASPPRTVASVGLSGTGLLALLRVVGTGVGGGAMGVTESCCRGSEMLAPRDPRTARSTGGVGGVWADTEGGRPGRRPRVAGGFRAGAAGPTVCRVPRPA